MRYDYILQRLTPGASYSFVTSNNAGVISRKADGTIITGENEPIYNDYDSIIWHDEIITQPSYEQCLAEWNTIKYENDLEQVRQKRKQEYGDVGDQLDMQYRDRINNTTEWRDHITAIKNNNPLPNRNDY